MRYSLDFVSAIRKISAEEAWKTDTLQKMNEAALLPALVEKKAVPVARKLILPFAAAVAVMVMPLFYVARQTALQATPDMASAHGAPQENKAEMGKGSERTPMMAATEPEIYPQEQAELHLFAGEGMVSGATQQGGYETETLTVLSCELVWEMPAQDESDAAQMPAIALPAYRFVVQLGTEPQTVIWVEALVAQPEK